MATTTSIPAAMLTQIADKARAAGVFGPVTVEAGAIVAAAKASAEPAYYRVELDGGSVWVSLVMKDRWLSESIETDLMHSGDKLEELIEDELVELGGPTGPVPFQHFRSADKLFTFRSEACPAQELERGGIATTVRLLLAYEATFRNLGDIDASEDQE